MFRTADMTNYFNYKREDAQNPNTGFMSFQAFKGEALYSDCIVKPENNMTETEHYECYPRPGYIEEGGDSQGFYPETSMVYIRFLWKEWEKKRGQYNIKFVKDIIEKAKQNNQSLIIRLMAHSTRSSDDVPDWLKELISCPERPDGKRVKDSPTDPLFLELFSEAIKNLGKAFDSEIILYAVDISLPGAWGEGHKLELYRECDLEKLYKTYTEYFKNTRLIGQFNRHQLIKNAAQTNLVGVRADGLGNPYHIYEMYPVEFKNLSDFWKTSPVSFEAFWWLGEWKRQGWDIDEIIQLSLNWHISSFNAKSLPIPFDWKDKIDYWVSKMGYHFKIDYFKYPQMACRSDEVELKLGIDNVGVAPIYDKIPLYIRLKGDTEYLFETEVDTTTWMPGKISERVIIKLPENVSTGEYEVQIGMYGQNYLMVYFATDAQRDNKFYKVGSIKVL